MLTLNCLPVIPPLSGRAACSVCPTCSGSWNQPLHCRIESVCILLRAVSTDQVVCLLSAMSIHCPRTGRPWSLSSFAIHWSAADKYR